LRCHAAFSQSQMINPLPENRAFPTVHLQSANSPSRPCRVNLVNEWK
jgi:hypothetical protein